MISANMCSFFSSQRRGNWNRFERDFPAEFPEILARIVAMATSADVKRLFGKFADHRSLVERAWLLRVLCGVAPMLSAWLGHL
jgi:hypothetical protein